MQVVSCKKGQGRTLVVAGSKEQIEIGSPLRGSPFTDELSPQFSTREIEILTRSIVSMTECDEFRLT